MATVGIRELKQNASSVVALAASGEEVTVTDRGRPVARVVPLRRSRLEELLASGSARPARDIHALSRLPWPSAEVTTAGSDALAALRDAERY